MDYMDFFMTPEAYLLHQISVNRDCLTKEKLMQLAEENLLEASPDAEKRVVAEALLEKMGAPWLAEQCEHFGVSAYSFQKKFGITNADVKRLANAGFLEITGSERFKIDGQYKYANLYNVFQFYQLEKLDITECLEEIKHGIQTV